MTRDLLDQLGELARQEQEPTRGDPRFEQHTEGQLDDETIRALEEADVSKEHAATVEASRPLDESARERFLQRAKAGLAQSPEGEPDAPEDSSAQAEHEAPAKVISFRAKRWYGAASAVGGVLAAAAVIFLLLRPAGQAPLPTYAISVTGGEQIVRSSDKRDDVVLGPGSHVRLVLRPDNPVEGRVETRTFVAVGQGDGDIRTIRLETDASADGAVRIEIPGDVFVRQVPADQVRVIVVVGRPGTLPERPEELLRARNQKSMQVLEQPIVVHR